MSDLTRAPRVGYRVCTDEKPLRLIEMHNKSIMAAISFVASVGGWFLWNIVLSLIYPVAPIYDVKGGFLYRFGRNPLWWLVLIITLIACAMFEVGVSSLRSAWFTTDVSRYTLPLALFPFFFFFFLFVPLMLRF